MTLQEFQTRYTGVKNVGDTSANTGQCVGLIEVWTDNLGLVHTWGNAKDLPAAADRSVFDVILNTPTNAPLPGDILCFDGFYGAGDGHTGIVVSATTDSATLFEQNDPEGSTPHLKTYSYAHAIGWLHPKILNQGGSMANTFTSPVNGDVRDAEGWYNAYAERNVQWTDDENLLVTLTNATGVTRNNLTATVQKLMAQPPGAPTAPSDLEKENNDILKQIWGKITSIFK